MERVIPDCAALHPGVEIDLGLEDRMVDIVAEGCDAGSRLGSTAAADKIGVPIGPVFRSVTVASPAYPAAHGTPAHPRDLESMPASACPADAP